MKSMVPQYTTYLAATYPASTSPTQLIIKTNKLTFRGINNAI